MSQLSRALQVQAPDPPCGRGADSSSRRHCRQVAWRGWRSLALGCAALLSLHFAPDARATEDNENSSPTAWWIYSGQNVNDIGNTIRTNNARIVDISKDPGAGFTVTYVENSGVYAKKWWWFVGLDANGLAEKLTKNDARLISLKADDVGGGNVRFAVARSPTPATTRRRGTTITIRPSTTYAT